MKQFILLLLIVASFASSAQKPKKPLHRVSPTMGSSNADRLRGLDIDPIRRVAYAAVGVRGILANLDSVASFLNTAMQDSIAKTVLAVDIISSKGHIIQMSGNRDTVMVNPAAVKFIRLGEGGKVVQTEALLQPFVILTQETYQALVAALATSQSPALIVTQLRQFIDQQLQAQAEPPKK